MPRASINLFPNNTSYFQRYLKTVLGLCNVLFKGVLISILVFVWCLNVLSFIATYVSISLWFEINKPPETAAECHTKKDPDYTDAQFLAYIYLLDKKTRKNARTRTFLIPQAGQCSHPPKKIKTMSIAQLK